MRASTSFAASSAPAAMSASLAAVRLRIFSALLSGGPSSTAIWASMPGGGSTGSSLVLSARMSL
eukprot:15485107-Alexandrium_andersonii.AAC.1